MHYILERLESDHRRMLSMLYLADKEITKMVSGKQGKVDTDKMLDILDYIQVFPESWHHPVESAVLTPYANRVNNSDELDNKEAQQAVIDKLTAQHRQLDTLSKQLTELFSDLCVSKSQPAVALQRLFKHYHHTEIQHISTERKVFEDINQMFNDEDWQHIEALLSTSFSDDQVNEHRFYESQAEKLSSQNVLANSLQRSGVSL
jgi:hemerythrin-like domain-containing protein